MTSGGTIVQTATTSVFSDDSWAKTVNGKFNISGYIKSPPGRVDPRACPDGGLVEGKSFLDLCDLAVKQVCQPSSLYFWIPTRILLYHWAVFGVYCAILCLCVFVVGVPEIGPGEEGAQLDQANFTALVFARKLTVLFWLWEARGGLGWVGLGWVGFHVPGGGGGEGAMARHLKPG